MPPELFIYLANTQSLITVDYHESGSVAKLKDVLKTKDSFLKDVDADRLNLYKPDTPFDDDNESEGKALAIVQAGVPLERIKPLSEYHLSLLPNKIHLVATVSGDSSQGTRLAARHIRSGSQPFMVSDTDTRREKLVKALYEAAEEYNFIQVRGIPACGKSTLLNLLHTYIVKITRSMKIHRIDCWPKTDERGYAERLNDITGKFPSENSTYLLFDEAQDTYADPGLWNGFFKAPSRNYRIVVFCSYGSPSARANIQYRTPNKVHPRQRLQLLLTEDFPYGLFFTRSEFDDMISRSSRFDIKIHLDDDVCTAIFDWTKGHVGSVKYFLESIKKQNGQYRSSGDRYTLEVFQLQHPDQRTAEDFIKHSASRGLPTRTELAEPETAILFREVLKDPSGAIELPNAAVEGELIDTCHTNGWLYSETTANHLFRYSFPTPLHRSYISWLLDSSIEELQFGEIFDLCKKVVLSFKPSQIFNVARRAGETAIEARPPDAQYQDEFYRALHSVTSAPVAISPEYASATNARKAGRIDFFIKSRKWGIEITRDGDRLKEHSDCFGSQGAYGHWLKTGEMKDYILLDCTTKPFRAIHPNIPRLYHAHFENDSTGSFVTIYDRLGGLVTERTALLKNS